MPRQVFKRGNVRISVDTRAIDALIDHTGRLDQVAAGMLADEASRVLRAAQSTWPVDTGKSRAGNRVAVTQPRKGTQSRVAVTNRMRYTVYILRNRLSLWYSRVYAEMRKVDVDTALEAFRRRRRAD